MAAALLVLVCCPGCRQDTRARILQSHPCFLSTPLTSALTGRQAFLALVHRGSLAVRYNADSAAPLWNLDL